MRTLKLTIVLVLVGIFGQAVNSSASQNTAPRNVTEEKPLPAWTLKEALKSKSPAQDTKGLQVRNAVKFPRMSSPKSECSIPLTRIEPRDKNAKIQNIPPAPASPQSVMRPPVPTCRENEVVIVDPDLIKEIPLNLK